MNTLLSIALLLAVAVLAIFVVPQWLLKRAIPQVIRIFREHNAIDIKNAKTVDELGLRRRSMFGLGFGRRDYKQYALTALMRAGIISVTEDGRFYLSEEKLIESGLERSRPYYR